MPSKNIAPMRARTVIWLRRDKIAAPTLLQKGDSPRFSLKTLSKAVAIAPAFRIGRDAMHIQYDWEKIQ